MREGTLNFVLLTSLFYEWINEKTGINKVQIDSFLNGIKNEISYELVAYVFIISVLAFYKRIFKESMQDTFYRFFGSNRKRTLSDVEKDMEELKKEVQQIRKDNENKS